MCLFVWTCPDPDKPVCLKYHERTVYNMQIPKKLIGLISAALTASSFALNANAVEPVHTTINNTPVDMDAQLIGQTTYVSYESASSLFSAATGSSHEISVVAGENYITVSGRYLGGAENLIIDGALFIPIRSIAEVYGADVSWDDATRSVGLTTDESYQFESGDSYYREDEVYWLSRIINAESAGEPMTGKILVGNVVLNRVRHDDFPNTIYGVIFDSKFGIQFTPTANGTIYKTPTAESVIAAKIVLDGYTLSREALYFLNPAIATSSWITENRSYVTTIGNHDFYS